MKHKKEHGRSAAHMVDATMKGAHHMKKEIKELHKHVKELHKMHGHHVKKVEKMERKLENATHSGKKTMPVVKAPMKSPKTNDHSPVVRKTKASPYAY